ncbi:annulin-like [Drosophila biarmipes]|uniref:annulin-like n=1 Tax=Drosophila biarmipes TaxID=125945 RepID=UPI0007E68479|nr:annulin-like [Drosophila biarmipes]
MYYYPNTTTFLYQHVTNSEVLSVEEVNLCLEDNHVEHHTSHFYAAAAKEALIVRRGQSFRLKIHFNRDYSPSKDAVIFILTVADDTKPSPGRGTLNAIVPFDNIDYLGDTLEWGAGIESHEGQTLTVLIKPPCTCPVTEWKLDIDTKLLGGESRSYALPLRIFVLFNPWCPDDQVYLEDPNQRKEYVMNDTTLIWRGSYSSLHESAWKIGQFERDVLECSLDVLGSVAKMPPAFRGDAVKVARALSALVNVIDDYGILVGNWTNDFSGGVAPFNWTGSTQILQEFFKTKQPVKFAQCWVYSGVLATIARSLGIPARIVTCFASAHDTQASLTVDYFVDENNKVSGDDSIWNFHAWNELWMQRLDLEDGRRGKCDGWQVVDATPQATSDNMFRLGPAPISSVKDGEVRAPFDVGFVFAEVNADILYWRNKGPGHPLKLINKVVDGVGKYISTKAVLKWEREDVTDSYKYAERSKEERSTMLKALKQCNNNLSRCYLNEDFNDVEFEMDLSHDIIIGKDFGVLLKLTNKSQSQAHVATGIIRCDAVQYNGRGAEEVKELSFELTLQPGGSYHVRMEVSFKEYFEKLSSKAAFHITAAAKVKDCDFEFFTQDSFRVRKPALKLLFGGGDIVVKKEMDVTVVLENPMPIPLRNGVFIVEAPGIQTPLIFKVGETPASDKAVATFKYVPPYAGRGVMVVKFHSMELDDVDGYINYNIAPGS